MKTESPKAYAVLYSSTFAFMVCFVVWMMFGVLGIQIRQELGLSAFEFGLLTSTPVLTGALFRLPLGIWTDRFGGRVMMTILLAGCSVPVYLVSYSQQLWHFLVIGLFLGLVGASFAIGTPYVARFFSAERKGFAMGFFGAGTVGAAVNLFLTPILLESFGWRTVPKIYAVVLLITAVAFWFVSAPDPGAGKTTGSLADQFRILRNPKVWRYCQYYSITFGGFTALSLWIPQYFQGEYGLTLVAAAALAAGFSLPGAILRAVGGGLADRFGAHNVTWWCLWVAWVCLFLLSYPDTQLTIKTLQGASTFHLYMPIWLFVAILFVLGAVFAFGMASTFKYVADDFPDNMGTVTGIVGLAGGLAGFLLPIMFGILAELFQIRSSCFMLLYGVVWVSLIIIYISEVKRVQISGDMIGPDGR